MFSTDLKYAELKLKMERTPGRKIGDGVESRELKGGGKFSCKEYGWTESKF